MYTGPTRITPAAGRRPTYWLYHELWRLLTGPDLRARLRVIRRGKDAIFDWADPLPFLLVHQRLPVAVGEGCGALTSMS